MGGAIIAPPGCLNVILGVNVYPLPELTISNAVTLPLVTVALISAASDPSLFGASTSTIGGLVSLYPDPPSRSKIFLIPLTNAAVAAPKPFSELIEILGGYSNLYPVPKFADEIFVN